MRGNSGDILMKTILTILIFICLLFASTSLSAKCMSRSVWAWPSAGKIPPDCHILVEGYGEYKDVIAAAEKRNPRLISKNHEVNLEVFKHYTGDMKVAQVLLRPIEKLKNGNTYWLVIDGIEEGFTFYDDHKSKRSHYGTPRYSRNPLWNRSTTSV